MLWFFWLRGMWDPSSPTRDWTCTPCIGRWSLNHGTTREVLKKILKRYEFATLKKYKDLFVIDITNSGIFFPISDQAVRRMLRKCCRIAGIDAHITPHMFRHTFATSLLEADVDIRYIQEFLGHSSIAITEIYTHATLRKQREILGTLHPRIGMKING